MWQLRDGGEYTHVVMNSIAYGGSPSVAYGEAFRREAAIALELIIKAVIAQRMTMRCADPAIESVPATHDLPTLWGQAGLTKLAWIMHECGFSIARSDNRSTHSC